MMFLLTALLLKSLLIFGAAGLLLLALRRSSAAARHLVCLGTLAALLALPLFSLALPGWHLPVLSTKAPAGTPLAASSAPAFSFPNLPATQSKVQAAAGQESAASSALTVTETAADKRPFPWTLVGAAFYALGVILASARPLLGLWGIHRLSRACVHVSDEPTVAATADCACLLGVALPCLCRADVPVPMTWGWRRPVVVLPESAAGWPDGRLRSVLLHELAHVKRRDWPGHRVADFACAVYWFHPLVWIIARRLRAESEAACDDLVLASGIPAPDYARHLLAIAQTLPPAARPPHSAIAIAQTSRIERRLLMLLDTTQSRRTTSRRALIFSIAIGAAALVPLAMLRPAAKAQPASSVAGTVQLVWVANASTPSGPAWDRNGNLLRSGGFSGLQESDPKISAPTGQKALFVAFHIPGAMQNAPRIVVNGSDAPLGRIRMTSANGAVVTAFSFNLDTLHGVTTYAAGFPAALPSANFQVGIASGQGKQTVDCPKTIGKVRLSGPAGDAIFTLLPHLQGGAVFMVSDHFRSSSPLKADNPLQVALHDGENYERSVYALDKSGKVLARLLVTPYTWPDAMGAAAQNYRSIKTQQTGHLSSVLVQHTASFRLVARPYQWTEFKNVALQPVQ